MSSLIYLVLLVLWGTECSSLTLTPTTTTISRNGTENFNLTCSTKDHNGNHLNIEIKGMRILKFENNEWTTVAEIDSYWQSPRTMDGLKSSAVVGRSDVNYLQVMWPLATNETSGQYTCDVIGYSKTEDGIFLRSPSVFVDVEVPLTLFSLLNMFKSTDKQLETSLGDISTLKEGARQSKKTQEDLLTMFKSTNKKLEIASEDISTLKERTSQSDKAQEDLLTMLKSTNKKLDTGLGDISKLKEQFSQSEKTQDDLSGSYFEQWPQGAYALIQTLSYCPANIGVTWKNGLRRHNTESQSRNKDQVSSPLHMMTEPMFQNGGKKYFFQTFCSVTTPSIGRLWPSGSYCVMRYKTMQCPIGFQVGSIYWDDEDTSNSNQVSGTHPVAVAGSNTKIYYCCRNDSTPLSPIHLPKTKPFFLHRYGGTCQEVVGMNVTSEFMLFHTESRSRYDGFAPDGASSLPMVKLELCYYEKE